MPTDPAIQELRSLVDLITQSLDAIEHTTAARGAAFPSLHEPFTRESDAIRSVPEGAAASNLLVSAAAQLIASVRHPGATAITTAVQVRD